MAILTCTFSEAAEWLRDQAVRHYPSSEFARQSGRVEPSHANPATHDWQTWGSGGSTEGIGVVSSRGG
jgi:hypothetical protein